MTRDIIQNRKLTKIKKKKKQLFRFLTKIPSHITEKLTKIKPQKNDPFLQAIELISAGNSMNEEEITHKPENSRGN
jgi:hypothetical protein